MAEKMGQTNICMLRVAERIVDSRFLPKPSTHGLQRLTNIENVTAPKQSGHLPIQHINISNVGNRLPIVLRPLALILNRFKIHN